ncbi:unnamed protein product [Amoebophrya sp. A120]|nr:unnamed protein product [Amoebophrya sp. A120]|eukprot:GSA120T00022512001.1
MLLLRTSIKAGLLACCFLLRCPFSAAAGVGFSGGKASASSRSGSTSTSPRARATDEGTSSSTAVFDDANIASNILSFPVGEAEDPSREQLRARAQKRLDDFRRVAAKNLSQQEVSQSGGVLQQLAQFLVGALNEKSSPGGRKKVAWLNKDTSRLVPASTGAAGKQALDADQTHVACRPWGSHNTDEIFLLETPWPSDGPQKLFTDKRTVLNGMVLDSAEYKKKLPEMQHWVFEGDVDQLEASSSSGFHKDRFPLIFASVETEMPEEFRRSADLPEEFRRRAEAFRRRAAGYVYPFFEARGLGYYVHGAREGEREDLVLKFSASPLSLDSLQSLATPERSFFLGRWSYPRNWLLAEGDGVFTFIRCASPAIPRRDSRIPFPTSRPNGSTSEERTFSYFSYLYSSSPGCEATVCSPA